MKKIGNTIGNVLYFIIFVVLLLYLLFVNITAIHYQTISYILGLIGIIVLLFFIFHNKDNKFICNKKDSIILLIIISLLIKGIVGILFFPNLIADYSTFHSFANVLSQSYHINFNTLYIALFNHVYGYSSILGFLYFIFGSHSIVAVIFNIILSVVSTVLIYLIGEKCFDKNIAFLSAILWIICPSQSLWNTFVLSEPLYTCILLAIIYLMLKNDNNSSKKTILINGSILGILLAIFNMIRPIGVILLFAIFLWMFLILRTGNSVYKIFIFIVITLVYLIVKNSINYIIEDRSSIKLGGFSWYNINVGLNYDTYGSWNQNDWDRILYKVNRYAKEEKSNPALLAQQDEKKIIYEKIKQIKNPFLFVYKKIYTFIGYDSGVVEHMKDSNCFTNEKQFIALSILCNSFYYLLLITSLIGSIIYCIKDKYNKNKGIILIILYGLGLASGHLIAEVQPRYHYSFIILLIFMSSYCFFNLKTELKGVKK